MAAIRDTTPRTEMVKYMEATIESIEASMGRGETIDTKKGSFKVVESTANRAIMAEFMKLVVQKKKDASTEACNLKLKVTGGKTPKGGLSMGDIDKPRKPSKGDIGEAVIAAAICARFVFKTGRVTPNNVETILKRLGSRGIKNYPGKTGKFVEDTFKSKNKGVKVMDDVHCYISLNLSAITASVKPRSEYGKLMREHAKAPYSKAIKVYLQSACNYVNTGKVSKWAKIVYENGRYDKIEVISDGLSDQKGTKVDTRVKITDYKGDLQPVNINLSMKVDDIGQFGQVSGMTFDVQQELWKQVFGYTSTVNALEPKWNELSQVKHDLKGALNMVYDVVYKKAKQDIKGDESRKKLIKQIAKALDYFATRHEEHVEMLNLGRHTKLYSFDDMESILMQVEDFDIVIRDQKNGYRQINIVGKSPKSGKIKEIISIRLRRQPEESKGPITYIRNLIEKKLLFGELVAESLD